MQNKTKENEKIILESCLDIMYSLKDAYNEEDEDIIKLNELVSFIDSKYNEDLICSKEEDDGDIIELNELTFIKKDEEEEDIIKLNKEKLLIAA